MRPRASALPSLFLALALPAPGAALPDPASPASGSISGRVVLTGPTPSLPVLRPRAECPASGPDERLLLDAEGRVANVVVVLESAAPPPPPRVPARAHLAIRDCRPVPHLQVLGRDQVLEIENRDPLGHTLRAWGRSEELALEVELPLQGQVVLQRLRRTGTFELRLDAERDAGGGWLVVLEPGTPFALTAPDGGFVLPEVPPGRHTLRFWHERLAERRVEVEVRPGEEASLRVPLLAP